MYNRYDSYMNTFSFPSISVGWLFWLCFMVSVMELAVEQFQRTRWNPCALCIAEGLHLSLGICIISLPVDVALVKRTPSIKVHFWALDIFLGESPFSLRNSMQFRRRSSIPMNWYEGHWIFVQELCKNHRAGLLSAVCLTCMLEVRDGWISRLGTGVSTTTTCGGFLVTSSSYTEVLGLLSRSRNLPLKLVVPHAF
jgi:Trk-type K+ transport system membrane component